MIALILAVAAQADVGQAIRDLAAPDLDTRTRAHATLVRAGRSALPALRAAEGADPEFRTRMQAVVEEIVWSDALAAVGRRVDEANKRTSKRRFEARELTSALSRRILPEARMWSLECVWQVPEFSSIVQPTLLFAMRLDEGVVDDMPGLDAVVRRAGVPMRTHSQASDFAALIGALWPRLDGTLGAGEGGWWVYSARAYATGKSVSIVRLETAGGVLRSVTVQAGPK